MRNDQCNLCSFGIDSPRRPDTVCLMESRPQRKEVVVVAESPGREDDVSGAPFRSRGLREIRAYLEKHGIDAHYTYAVKCCKPNKGAKVTEKITKICSEDYLRLELMQMKPKHIVVLGGNSMYGATKKRGISTKQGACFWDTKLNAWIYPTYHHLQALYNLQVKGQFWDEMALYVRWIKNEESDEDIGFEPPVYIADTPKELRKVQKMIRASGGVVAVDIETQGLNQFDTEKHVRCIQFCWDEDVGGVFVPLALEDDCYYTDKNEKAGCFYETPGQLEAMVEIIREILFESSCVWHNGKFDRLWLWLWGANVFGKPILAPNIAMDTFHVAHLLNENRPLKLKRLITSELGYPSYDIPDKLTKDLDLLIPYATRDTVATLILAKKYAVELSKPENQRIKRLYTHVIKRVDALYTRMEIRGWPINKKICRELIYTMEEALEEVESKLRKMFKRKGVQSFPIDHLGKADRLRWLLFEHLEYPITPYKQARYTKESRNTKNPILATNTDALLHIKKDPLISTIIERRKIMKALSTYLSPMLAMAETRGRITTSYKIVGTSTGRTASGKEDAKSKRGSAMNLQNLMPTFGIKRAIRAPKGSVLLDLDFSQIELRVIGDEAQDPLLIDTYKNNRDLHTIRAMRIMGLTEEEWNALEPEQQKEYRGKAKPGNFGLIYGMGVYGFIWYALSKYDVEYTLKEGKHIHTGFFKDHRGLRRYYEKQERQATRLGYVENKAGRRRHLPNVSLNPDLSDEAKMAKSNAVRQAINSPIQSFASDLKLMAMIEIEENLVAMGLDDGDVRIDADAFLFGEVHDSILIQVKETRAIKVAKMALRVMRHPRLLDKLDIAMSLPIDADCKVGKSLNSSKDKEPGERWRKGSQVSLSEFIALKAAN